MSDPFLDGIMRRMETKKEMTATKSDTPLTDAESFVAMDGMGTKRKVVLATVSADIERQLTHTRRLLVEAAYFVYAPEIQCNGLKCRQLNCSSCYDEETVREEFKKAESLRAKINAAIKEQP
jgi:hypothetical protein